MGLIYMYTNKINNKKYIGQTTRSLKIRHQQHLSQCDTYFDKALHKYGENNFSLEILEDNIDDIKVLNQKEEYYIQLYNTFEDGYNLNRGGDNRTRFSVKDRDYIIYLLKNTTLTSVEIAEKVGYSVYTINDINTGNTFPVSTENYPIRKHGCRRYNEDDIDAVIELLKNSTYSFEKIAELTHTEFTFVCDINRGKRSFLNKKDIHFPIRETVKRAIVSLGLAEKIVKELKNDNKTASEIGNMFNVPAYTVGSINRGKHSICKQLNEKFPIRKKQHKSHTNYSKRKLSDKQILEIVDLLVNTTLNLEEIAQRYGVERSAISRINRGIVFKPLLSSFKFPIRQNKEFNLLKIDYKNR